MHYDIADHIQLYIVNKELVEDPELNEFFRHDIDPTQPELFAKPVYHRMIFLSMRAGVKRFWALPAACRARENGLLPAVLNAT